jgi:glutamate racemase
VLAERLLAPINEAKVDALLLGCTHYPYLARTITDVVGRDVVLVSSADETAFEALAMVRSSSPAPGEPALTSATPGRTGTHRFVSSGDVDRFRDLGARLLGPELVAAERAPWTP